MKTTVPTFSNCRPLCSLDSEHLLISQRNKLFSFNLNTHQKALLAEIPSSWKQKVCSHSVLASRLLRLGVHTALKYKDAVYFAFDKKIYTYDVELKKVSLESSLARGTRPLNFAVVENIKGFDNGIYYGEYFFNESLGPVHIFKHEGNQWKNVFSFPEKTIEHIHNIIPDPYQNCLWILTGDFGQAAGIWRATDNFKKIEPVCRGQQQYRACVAFPTEHGLLYATDSQMELNQIRLLVKKDIEFESQILCEINGPSIYGCRLKDYFVFSTSTEPPFPAKNTLTRMLGRKKGPGVIHDQAEILVFDKNFKLRYRYCNSKDALPYTLFQFGSVTFPTGMEFDNLLVSFNIALKTSDFSMEIRQNCFHIAE